MRYHKFLHLIRHFAMNALKVWKIMFDVSLSWKLHFQVFYVETSNATFSSFLRTNLTNYIFQFLRRNLKNYMIHSNNNCIHNTILSPKLVNAAHTVTINTPKLYYTIAFPLREEIKSIWLFLHPTMESISVHFHHLVSVLQVGLCLSCFLKFHILHPTDQPAWQTFCNDREAVHTQIRCFPFHIPRPLMASCQERVLCQNKIFAPDECEGCHFEYGNQETHFCLLEAKNKSKLSSWYCLKRLTFPKNWRI